jgi:hypothetical protein
VTVGTLTAQFPLLAVQVAVDVTRIGLGCRCGHR